MACPTFGLGAVAAAFSLACDAAPRPGALVETPATAAITPFDASTAGFTCPDGIAGCPCATPGATVDCGTVTQKFDAYVTCADGQSTCTDGAWSACAANAFSIRRTASATLSRARVALVRAPCSNPCDPNPGCTQVRGGPSDTGDASGVAASDGAVDLYEPPCRGLQCSVHACPAQPNGTTLRGRVFDPAGLHPVYRAWVYVPTDPAGALAPLASGVQCSACAGAGPLDAVSVTQTAADGSFTLTHVPDGVSVPVVVQLGKWRREVQVAAVAACADGTVADGTLHLPARQTDGLGGRADLPQIAFVSGSADPLECMLLKAGVDPTEFGSSGKNAARRIHVYASPDSSGSPLDPALGDPISAARLWNAQNAPWNLGAYDLAMFACEGREYPASKPATALANVAAYANAGGRVLLSHDSDVWMKDGAAWKSVAGGWLTPDVTTQDPLLASVVSSSFPTGVALQTWLADVGALASGSLPIHEGAQNASLPLASAAQAWFSATDATRGNEAFAPAFSFDAPFGAPAGQECGRTFFTQFHASKSAQVVADSLGHVACAADTDCGFGSTCTPGTLGTCQAQPCGVAGDCADATFACSGAVAGVCRRASCGVAGRTCASGQCIAGSCGCTSNADCGAAGLCDPTTHACVPSDYPCHADAECVGGAAQAGDATCAGAVQGTCSPRTCASNTDCAAVVSASGAKGHEQCAVGRCAGCYAPTDCPGTTACNGGVPATCTGDGRSFPAECARAAMTPQEAALEFAFFDLAACVAPDATAAPAPGDSMPTYRPATFSVDVTSNCSAGFHVAWRELDWRATVPTGASITFAAQTADPGRDGGAANYAGSPLIALAQATAASPSGQALVDVLATDGGPLGAFETASPPVASKDDLRLTITLTPTPDGRQSPALVDWQIRYDCPASE